MPAENGYVPTPAPVADLAAAEVFGAQRPSAVANGGRLLLPGLGTGNLYAAVRRYCTAGETWNVPQFGYPLPECVGVETDSARIATFRESRPTDDITVSEADFLLEPPAGRFDWVLANPPFTRYDRIPAARRAQYRERFETATGQFPLYAPFLEQALRLVNPDGWVTFILPVKALTIGRTEAVRALLRRRYVGFIGFLPPQTFARTVDTCLLTVQKRPHPPTGLWLEPILPYGPQPLLERLGIDDVDAASDQYSEQFEAYCRRIDQDYRPPHVAEDAPSPHIVSTQANLARWSE